MINYSFIITTYNRPERVSSLVEQLISLSYNSFEVIVVDSSDDCNNQLIQNEKVKYISSKHKNQPYQRYLGYLVSNNQYLIFLDDDMELVNENLLIELSDVLNENDVAGIALNFRDKQEDSSLSAIPTSTLFKKSTPLKRFKNWFTGYPDLPIGVLGRCGIRGGYSNEISRVEYVSGGAFVANRQKIFKDFNFQLFDLFEQKIGMGEDTIIGYSLNKQGEVLFVPEIYFLHNDQKDSNYSLNVKVYAKRVMFSRLYLSLEKARLDKTSIFAAKVHYQWYAFWRIFGLLINLLIKRRTNVKLVLLGSWSGWMATFSFRFRSSINTAEYWTNEAKVNLGNDK